MNALRSFDGTDWKCRFVMLGEAARHKRVLASEREYAPARRKGFNRLADRGGLDTSKSRQSLYTKRRKRYGGLEKALSVLTAFHSLDVAA